MTTTIGWISAAVMARTGLRHGQDRPRRGRGDLGEGVISAAMSVHTKVRLWIRPEPASTCG